MKRYSLILLALFYFIGATGVYVHAHYCGNELAELSYSAINDQASCGCGEEAPADDCCKDITHFYKVDSHQSYESIKANEACTLVLFFETASFIISRISSIDSESVCSSAHAPPPYLFAKASKLIVNCVFRI